MSSRPERAGEVSPANGTGRGPAQGLATLQGVPGMQMQLLLHPWDQI